jgi:glycosyltransferase involved in cell wall biosynthesis
VPRVTIAISHHVKQFVESLGTRPAGTVRVVHYGIDAGAWQPERGARAAARKRFHLGDGDVAVAITSRIIPGKGHAVLLDAVRRAQLHAPSLRLLVAGDGPLRRSLQRNPDSEGVSFLGFQPDVRPLLHAADVLAFPTSASLSEGFGLTALEAMAAGRAVVGSHVGAIPEVVSDGETGLLVPPDNPEALADALVRIARDPGRRAAMGRAGADRAEHAFSLSQMVGGTLAVYSEALGRPVVRRAGAAGARTGRSREVAHVG